MRLRLRVERRRFVRRVLGVLLYWILEWERDVVVERIE